jgi:hypothetical protein
LSLTQRLGKVGRFEIVSITWDKKMKLDLSILEDIFTIHRFPPGQQIPEQIYESQFFSISKTENELSIVCSSSISLDSESSEPDWSCMKVLGTLNFSLTGILADISAVLAKAEVSIFAISTFDTDYILVKSEKLSAAHEALEKAGCTFKRGTGK